jgi:hypothetical protein
MKGHRLRGDKVCEEIEDLDDLRERSERMKLKNSMIKSTASTRHAPTIDLSYTFLKLPFVPGSSDSKKMLQVLDDLGESEIFETNLIKNFLDFKWEKVRLIAYILTLVYFGYLMCIAFTDSWIAVLAWLIYFLLIEAWQLITSGTDDDSKWE